MLVSKCPAWVPTRSGSSPMSAAAACTAWRWAGQSAKETTRPSNASASRRSASAIELALPAWPVTT